MMTRREMNSALAAAVAAFFAGGISPRAEKVASPQGGVRGRMHGQSSAKTLMSEPLAEIPDAEASLVMLTVAPGAVSPPHEHTGPVFAYILEGEIENQVEPNPPKTYTAGDYFYEPAMHVHKMLRNLSKVKPARLLIFQVGQKGKQFTIGVKP